MRYVFVMIVMLLTGCGIPECHNSNPIFNKYEPQAPEYTRQLAKQISGHDREKLSYWINVYTQAGRREYMQVWVRGDGLCATMAMDITGSSRLQQYRRVKGISYSGAELSGLDYTIRNDSDGYHFIFRDVDWIVD